MKRVFNMVGIILAASLIAAQAIAGGWSTKGDEHPFPFSCFNFSGVWTSEGGDEYRIAQSGCKRLDIDREIKGGHDVQRSTIVPDNRSRKVNGEKWHGSVRHRWNAKQYGSTVETYRFMRYEDREVSEVVLIESVNEALMLETVYRTISPLSPVRGPFSENFQRIFRRAKVNDTGDKDKPKPPKKR